MLRTDSGMASYSRPPIVEAVVELRFGGAPASEKSIRDAQRHLRSKYPNAEDQQLIDFMLPPGGRPSINARFSGVKLSRHDQTEIAVVTRSQFSRSMLPPYQGYEAFRASIVHDFGACSDVYKGMPCARIGMRFINRLDIPSSSGAVLEMRDYMRIMTAVPSLGQGAIISQSSHVIMPLPDPSALCVINFGTVPSPLVAHLSLLLDIEVFQDKDLPVTGKALWARLDELRDLKNTVFEACITDATRRTFEAK